MRRLAPALAAFSVQFSLKLERSSRAELVDVAAGKARAVGAVPVLFKQHVSLASGARAGRCAGCLHLFGPFLSDNKKRADAATGGLAPSIASEVS